MSIFQEIIQDPEKFGYKECGHCNGYGSSLKDPDGVDRCSQCGGSGVIKSC
jgi:DnaJ-class molecular chaperone